MTSLHAALPVILLAAVLPATALAESTKFADVLDTPALMSPLAAKSLLQSVTRASNRIVAVGQRGQLEGAQESAVHAIPR